MVENQSTIKPRHAGAYNANFRAGRQILGFMVLSWRQMARVKLSIARRLNMFESRES